MNKFKSYFNKEINDFIIMKKSLGFKYLSEERELQRLDRTLYEFNVKIIDKDFCDRWIRKREYESIKTQANRIVILRNFTYYLNDIGIKAYILPKNLVRKSPKYQAHIYTDDELRRFFKAVDSSVSIAISCPYRAKIMPLFFRILYTSGMRVSELRLVKIKNFNLNEGYIFVSNAKNNKERIIPINESLLLQCKQLKDEIHKNSSDDEFFFLIRKNTPMTLRNLYNNFRRYLEKAGISHSGKGPRIHDFRHTYCVNLLRKWVDEGKDLMAYLPYMKTILGHETFEETAYYLKLTSERFPYIKETLYKSFPNIIEEVELDESEFY